MCPLCGEENDTSLHLIGKCSALAGKLLLVPSELRKEHWSSLLKFAGKTPRGFSNQRVNSDRTLGPLKASVLGSNTPSP